MAKNLKMAKMAENGSFFILFPLFTDFICKRVIEMQMYKLWCLKMEKLSFYGYFNLTTELSEYGPKNLL